MPDPEPAAARLKMASRALAALFLASFVHPLAGHDACPAMTEALDVMAYLKNEQAYAHAASESANQEHVAQYSSFETRRQNFEARLRKLAEDIGATEKIRFDKALAGAELGPTDALLSSLIGEQKRTEMDRGTAMDTESRVLRQVEEETSRREAELELISQLVRYGRARFPEGCVSRGGKSVCL